MASAFVFTGELGRAAELLAEEEAITRATGAPPYPNARLGLAAWRGVQPGTPEFLATMVEEATARGEGLPVSSADMALAYLHNGLGNCDRALVATSRLIELDELAHSSAALPELVEAAVRADQPERAAAALGRTGVAGRRERHPVGARDGRALARPGEQRTERRDHYREAIERLGNCRMATHLARAHLIYGEWLHRQGRRQDARSPLRTAPPAAVGHGC
jgi:hypothetical protein